MKRRQRLHPAVVTRHPLLRALWLLLIVTRRRVGLLLFGQDGVQHAKVRRKVAQGFATQRAGVVVLGVRLEARGVHEVTARQALHRRIRVEQKVLAHRALALHRSGENSPAITALGASSGVLRRRADVRSHGERDAAVALHAVEEILAETFAAPAHVAERAVIHVVAAVVPKVANGAKVPRDDAAALAALLRRRLPRAAPHADHLLGRVPIDGVILSLVVAEPADVRGAAAGGNQTNLPGVVLAPQDRFPANRLAQHDIVARALVVTRQTGRARERERRLGGVRRRRGARFLGSPVEPGVRDSVGAGQPLPRNASLV
mmetsp:Transcript_2286/g.10123  ORF Transcript_2286/g.10123 Transcript_2286/m.10123 type:complete len:317 (+) Transcript_2286:3928-4878(+)